MTLAASGDHPFGIGDVVRLNGGTLRMTVAGLRDGRVVCEWHDQDDAALEADFDPRMLTLVKARES